MNLARIAGAVLLTAGLWVNTACNNEKAKTETTETTQPAKVTDKAYICPMKCEGSASDQPGKCPVCAMDLEKNPDYVQPAVQPADGTHIAVPADTVVK
jgi:hypothetical protein